MKAGAEYILFKNAYSFSVAGEWSNISSDALQMNM
jgi:hypothetical protein